jgi:hypothetical protein
MHGASSVADESAAPADRRPHALAMPIGTLQESRKKAAGRVAHGEILLESCVIKLPWPPRAMKWRSILSVASVGAVLSKSELWSLPASRLELAMPKSARSSSALLWCRELRSFVEARLKASVCCLSASEVRTGLGC